jgi:hypothetical protein
VNFTPRPRFGDWALLGVSGVFTALGVVLLVATTADRHMAFASTAFFGLCTSIAAVVLSEKRRTARFAAKEGVVESAQGRIPEAKVRPVAGGAMVAVLGGLLVTVPGAPLPLRLASGAMVLGGLGLVGAVALGLRGNRWLQFEVAGLRVGNAARSFLMPWSDIVGCQRGEMNSNPVVLVQLGDLTGALASAEPAAYAGTVAAMLPDGQLTIFPMAFGLDAGLFARSIATYVTDPARRERLAQPLLG